MNPSILNFQRYRYLRWALLLVGASLAAYIALLPPIGYRTGASWVGYILGTIGAVLIVWLSWFGVRKRAYHSPGAKLQGWLSAHVYLGVALLIVGTLHTGFDFGWNIHTLAYALMVIVIVSGMFGVYAYLRYPTEMTAGRSGVATEVVLARIQALDREFSQLAKGEGAALAPFLAGVTDEPVLGQTMRQQLGGRVKVPATRQAIARLEGMLKGGSGVTALQANQALTLLRRKQDLLTRVRREHQLRAMMKVWLYFHVPLAMGLLAALTGHIVAVFYW